MEDVKKKKKKMKILVDLHFHTSKLLICFVGFFAFASQYCYLPESSCTVFTVSAFMLAVNRKASFTVPQNLCGGLLEHRLLTSPCRISDSPSLGQVQERSRLTVMLMAQWFTNTDSEDLQLSVLKQWAILKSITICQAYF